MTEAHAIQRTARQSPYKMRLVMDQVRGCFDGLMASSAASAFFEHIA